MNVPLSDFYLRKGGKLVVETSRDLLIGKRTVIIMVPGAFTPTCTDQLSAFEAAYSDFTAKGIEQILCVSVNDGFVMNAWGKSLKIKKVKLIPDGNGTFTNGVKALVDKGNLGMGSRSWRIALILDENGNVEWSGVEEGKRDFASDDLYEATTPEKVLEAVDLVEAAKAQATAAEALAMVGAAAE